jgi:hypothetical protein
MKRYIKNSPKPHYEVDTWVGLLGPIGYWKTQIITVDFDYAVSVFEDYKHNRRGTKPTKDAAVLIHYE